MDQSNRPVTDRYAKRRDPVEVEIAQAPGVLATLEGEVGYNAGDALITGVKGERWPASRERFERTYEALPPTRPGESGRYSRTKYRRAGWMRLSSLPHSRRDPFRKFARVPIHASFDHAVAL